MSDSDEILNATVVYCEDEVGRVQINFFDDHGNREGNQVTAQVIAQSTSVIAKLNTQKAVTMDRLHYKLLILLVGAWGFEPQTPTVSILEPVCY